MFAAIVSYSNLSRFGSCVRYLTPLILQSVYLALRTTSGYCLVTIGSCHSSPPEILSREVFFLGFFDLNA